MPQQNDVERSIERLQEVLQGTRVTRARLQQARASNPEHTARRGMSETSDIGEQQPATERQGPTSATISRQFRAEREGEISFDDPDFSRPDGSFLTSNDYSREAGAVGGRLGSHSNGSRLATAKLSLRFGGSFSAVFPPFLCPLRERRRAKP